MSNEILKTYQDEINRRNKYFKEKYGDFTTLTDKLKNARVSKDFWKIEADNIISIVNKGKEERESMRMSDKKFRQPFTI